MTKRFRVDEIHARAAFKGCAYALTEAELQDALDDFPDQYAWAVGIPLETWARVRCPVPRFNIMTSNHAESFNSSMLPARELGLTSLFHALVVAHQRRIFDSRESGAALWEIHWSTSALWQAM